MSSWIARVPSWLWHLLGALAVCAGLAALAVGVRHWIVGAWSWRDGADLWLVLDRATILYSFVTIGVVLYTGAIGLRPTGWLRRLVSRRRQFEDAESAEIRDKADAVVMMVGHSPALSRVSVDLLKPSRLVLIGTKLDTLVDAKHTVETGIRTDIARVVYDESDSGDVLRVGREVLERLMRVDGIARERIVCDITGGTKAMTVGLFMAAEEAGVAAAYIRSERDERTGKPVEGTSRLRYITRPSGG